MGSRRRVRARPSRRAAHRRRRRPTACPQPDRRDLRRPGCGGPGGGGRPRPAAQRGGAALGLILGGGNGFLAVRLLGIGVAFAATSILRLLILTMLAVLSGFVLGWERAILVAAGMAVAQLVLSAASLREVLRTR